MKKVFMSLIVLSLLVMMPFCSFGKTIISDEELQDMTAQEGVTINFNCFTVGAISIAVQSWGDSDGCSTCGGFTSAGWVGASVNMSSNFVSMTGNMTIDVGSSGTKTALIIGLPTLNLAGSITQVVKLSTSPTLGSAGTLGTSFMSGLSVTPTGQLIIYAH
ncbi:MAG: hypothetical protein JW976_01315 [Syntrophaceae bacterium]|nr:hypothetical protein [Syntrophaceae bacterium]